MNRILSSVCVVAEVMRLQTKRSRVCGLIQSHITLRPLGTMRKWDPEL